jgi:hypothetical protein
MNLPVLPTIFTKDGDERKAYHTVEARELIAAGWVESSVTKTTVVTVTQELETKGITEEKPKVIKAKPVAVKENKIEELK